MLWHLMKYCVLVILTYACTKESIEPEIEDEIPVFTSDPTLIRGGCPDSLSPIYLESGGILAIEMESAVYQNTSWKLDSTLADYSNAGYLVWKGDNEYNTPGKGNLTFNIRIETVGKYRFIWKSRITQGDSNTDFNDSWLRLADADHFYGQKDDGNIVYPKGSTQEPIEESSGQQHTEPEGSGRDGWFKVYMNTVNRWHWRATTSDNDPHQLYAIFDDPGDYKIEISGRSFGHGIDKLLMYHTSTNLVADRYDAQELSVIECE